MRSPDEVPAVVAPAADAALDTPNCPECLHPMVASATPSGAPYWSCAVCGAARVV